MDLLQNRFKDWLFERKGRQQNGVWRLGEMPPQVHSFEGSYLSLRQKEGRLLSDPEVKSLPGHSPRPNLRREWAIRAWTARRLLRHIQAQTPQDGPLLEIGCGNGWLSAFLAQNLEREVIGQDLNLPELEQAARVWTLPSLAFLQTDLFAGHLPLATFDHIVLAAAIQYFPDLPLLLSSLRALLRPEGIIWVADSPFYAGKEACHQAQNRTLSYYERMGYPELAEFYHAHDWGEAQGLGGHLCYDPRKWTSRLARTLKLPFSPFPLWAFSKKTPF